ncbi:hypothetical protein D3C76_1117460 [compost metagenome]
MLRHLRIGARQRQVEQLPGNDDAVVRGIEFRRQAQQVPVRRRIGRCRDAETGTQ